MRSVFAFLCVMAISAPAGAYECIVQDFKTFSDEDKAFIQNNLKKTYTLKVEGDRVRIDMRSDHYQDGTTHYKTIRRSMMSMTAIDDDPARAGTITVPQDPQSRIDRNGYFNAVISINGSFYANTWLLKCQ